MDDASSFSCTDVLPWHDGVDNALFCGQLVKWAAIAPTQHFTAFQRLCDVVVSFVTPLKRFQHREEFLCQVIILAILFYFDVGQVGVYCCRDVSSQCPRRGRPDKQVFTRMVY